jgi:hypothetical protein
MFVHQQGRRVSTSQRHYQMINSTLHAFVTRVRRSGRLNFGDIKELQRDILPDGLIAREEAEALLALDRAITQAHPAWSGYLVTTLVDFVVWGVRPTGSIDRETARWLVEWLSCETPSRAVAELARELAAEANDIDGTLVGALKAAKARPEARV